MFAKNKSRKDSENCPSCIPYKGRLSSAVFPNPIFLNVIDYEKPGTGEGPQAIAYRPKKAVSISSSD